MGWVVSKGSIFSGFEKKNQKNTGSDALFLEKDLTN